MENQFTRYQDVLESPESTSFELVTLVRGLVDGGLFTETEFEAIFAENDDEIEQFQRFYRTLRTKQQPHCIDVFIRHLPNAGGVALSEKLKQRRLQLQQLPVPVWKSSALWILLVAVLLIALIPRNPDHDDFVPKNEDISSIADPNEKLLMAASVGNVKLVAQALRENAAIDSTHSERDNTALHLAALYGHAEVVKFILDYFQAKGKNMLEITNKWGNTPFLEAATSAVCCDVLKELLQRRPPVKFYARSSENGGNNYAFHQAAFWGRLDVVKFLLARPERRDNFVEIKNKLGHTPFLEAAAGGQVEVMRYLLEEGYADFLATANKTGFRNTAMHLAAKSDNPDAVTFLSDYSQKFAMGPWLLQLDNSLDRTPFLEAASGGQIKTLQRLLELGSSMTDASNEAGNGHTAIHLAAEFGHVDTVDFLLKRFGGKGGPQTLLESRNVYGYTPFMVAAASGQVAVMEHLRRLPRLHVNVFARSNHLQNTGPTAIHLAAHYGHAKVIESLLDYNKTEGKLLLESKAGKGRTPLQYALVNCKVDAAIQLLQHGANPNVLDDDKADAISLIKYCPVNTQNLLIKLLELFKFKGTAKKQ